MVGHRWGADGSRAQSEVLGFVLLVWLVLAMSFSVVIVGSGALDDARAASESEDATMSFLAMQSQIADLNPNEETAHRLSFAESLSGGAAPAPGANVEGGNQGAVVVDPSAGHIEISTDQHTIVDENLGAIEYVDGETELAYQGGAVFRSTSDSKAGVAEAPPPFDFRSASGEQTISIPIRHLSTESGGAVSDTGFTFEAERSRFEPLPEERDRPATPIEGVEGEIELTVRSDYYRAWGKHLEDTTGVTPTYDHGAKEVSMTIEQAGGGGAGSVGVDWVQITTKHIEVSPE
jgi:hypothetical protein